MTPSTFLIGALAIGCFRPPPEAPKELDELTAFLFAEWDNEDPLVMTAGLDNLQEFFDGIDIHDDVNVMDRAWELTPIGVDALEGLPRPDGTDPSDCYGVSVARQSIWPVEDHAQWQTVTDQLPAEPSAVLYQRTFPEVDDASCWPDGSCELLLTRNEVERSNFLMTISMVLNKHFRWVELSDGQTAMISRAWLDDTAWGENENNVIWQSWSMDIWLPKNGVARRYQVLWSQADVAGSSDEIQMATVKTSTESHFEATDEAIEGL